MTLFIGSTTEANALLDRLYAAEYECEHAKPSPARSGTYVGKVGPFDLEADWTYTPATPAVILRDGGGHPGDDESFEVTEVRFAGTPINEHDYLSQYAIDELWRAAEKQARGVR